MELRAPRMSEYLTTAGIFFHAVPFQEIRAHFFLADNLEQEGMTIPCVKLYIIWFPVPHQLGRNFRKPLEQRSESNPRETFNSSWKGNLRKSTWLWTKKCTGPYIMLLIIRHTRSIFFNITNQRWGLWHFRKKTPKSPVGKRLLQQSLTFTIPQKSQPLNPKGSRGQHTESTET